MVYIQVKNRAKLVATTGKMSMTEREILQQSKASLEAQKMNESFEVIKDKGAINAQISEIDKKLVLDEERIANKKERDALMSERDRLGEQIKNIVPPMRVQQAKPEDKSAYVKAVAAAEKALSPVVTNLCNQYRDICRRLEPEDPAAGSIEVLVGA